MTDRPLPKLAKWPFFLADAVLLLLACWIVAKQPHPLSAWPLFLMVASVAGAFVFAVWPYVLEYRAELAFSESKELTNAVAEIQKLQTLADQIRTATGQWQTVQEHSNKAVGAAKDITDRMALEARAFTEFMQKSGDSEKGHLRLEVEKARRSEGEWLQIVVRLIDHVYALHQAAAHSGQPNVQQQIGLFQNACRDVVRRVGLLPLEAELGEGFDDTRHRLLDNEPRPEPDAVIAETLATGFSFQGQMLRPILVRVVSQQASPASVETAPVIEEEAIAEAPAATTEPEADETSHFHTPPPTEPPAPPQPTPAEPELIHIAGTEPAPRREADPDWTAEGEFRLGDEPKKSRRSGGKV